MSNLIALLGNTQALLFLIIHYRRPALPAAPGTLYLKLLHQPLNRTASNINAFSQQLLPHLACAINLEIVFSYPLYVEFQFHVPLYAIRQSIRVSFACFMFVIARRGNLNLPADWLDPILLFMSIDKYHHHFGQRSSSRFSRSSCLSRSRSADGRPPRIPCSVSARLIHVRNVSAVQPIFDAIDLIADHCDSCSFCCSNTNRAARPRTSSE